MKYVIVSKRGGQVVFMKSFSNDSDDSTWTTDLNEAILFEKEGNDNGVLAGCWSGGMPADTLAVDESRAITETDKLMAWQEWDMPIPNYWDSESGCKRMVITGPRY